MALFTKPSDMTEYIRGLLTTQFVPGTLKAVYYSDQRMIPHFPAATVESEEMERSLHGKASTHKFELILRTQIILYHEQIQPGGTTLKSTEELAETVAAYLKTVATLGNQVIMGFVTRMSPGIVVTPERVMLRATRIMFEAWSQEIF